MPVTIPWALPLTNLTNRIDYGCVRLVMGIFDLSEVKNMELSRMCSTCHGYIRLVRSYGTWNCHGYVPIVRGKEHRIVTGIIYPWQVEHIRDNSIFFTSDKSNIPMTSRTHPWQINVLKFWHIGNTRDNSIERGIITGIFDMAEVKNMELSRVYSICQKLGTWNCHGYFRFVRS
jgi:hypothetical protein